MHIFKFNNTKPNGNARSSSGSSNTANSNRSKLHGFGVFLTAIKLLTIISFGHSAESEVLKFKPLQYPDVQQGLQFASYYSDHMVLQKSPKQANVWGYADSDDVGHQVVLTIRGPAAQANYTAVIKKGPIAGWAVWSVALEPVAAGGPYIVTVTRVRDAASVALRDVMFGDVWVCSGQSNMKFTLRQTFNATEEIAAASSYKHIRVMSVSRVTSDVPLYDLQSIDLPWSLPSADTVGHGDWTFFSAVCWLYGRKIYDRLHTPLGLIESTWGGTPVEAWSSPEALARCHLDKTHPIVKFDVGLDDSIHYMRDIDEAGVLTPPPHEHAVLWNAMIHPLLNLTIYGAIWYQGEANAAYPDTYNCTFPAMIDDWRSKFITGQQFPFGFVQLAPNRNDSSIVTGFPDIRWHQTADFGYVPNAIMRNVFMSVAMDLPDFTSPFGSIHPRDKEDVTTRLALSGLSVAYNMNLGKFQGPRPSAYYVDIGFHTLGIEFDSGKSPIIVKSNGGFEVCCSPDNQTYCDLPRTKWIPTPIVANTSTSVTVSYQPCAGEWIVGLRYAWRESPCAFKQCAVYSKENTLPMAPFLANGLFNSGKVTQFNDQRHISAP